MLLRRKPSREKVGRTRNGRNACHLRERSKHLITARNWAIGVMSALAGLSFFLSEANRIWQIPIEIAHVAYLVLVVVIVLLIFLWIWCTQAELDLLL